LPEHAGPRTARLARLAPARVLAEDVDCGAERPGRRREVAAGGVALGERPESGAPDGAVLVADRRERFLRTRDRTVRVVQTRRGARELDLEERDVVGARGVAEQLLGTRELAAGAGRVARRVHDPGSEHVRARRLQVVLG